MADASQRLHALVEPLVLGAGASLFDLERTGGKLIVTIDREDGVGIDVITEVTRAISRALDEEEVIEGTFVLEVTSPGLERSLRSPAQFAWAVGRAVSLRLSGSGAAEAGERRCVGTVRSADDHGIELVLDEPPGEVVRLAYDIIQRARTVVDWDAELKAGATPPDERAGQDSRGSRAHEKKRVSKS